MSWNIYAGVSSILFAEAQWDLLFLKDYLQKIMNRRTGD